MSKLTALVSSGVVDVDLVHETVGDLLGLTQEVAKTAAASEGGAGLGEDDLVAYAAEKHLHRMDQITNASTAPPKIAID